MVSKKDKVKRAVRKVVKKKKRGVKRNGNVNQNQKVNVKVNVRGSSPPVAASHTPSFYQLPSNHSVSSSTNLENEIGELRKLMLLNNNTAALKNTPHIRPVFNKPMRTPVKHLFSESVMSSEKSKQDHLMKPIDYKARSFSGSVEKQNNDPNYSFAGDTRGETSTRGRGRPRLSSTQKAENLERREALKLTKKKHEDDDEY